MGRAGAGFKSREERRKVLVSARMRVGARWSDVCIRDYSSRGLGLQAASPPPLGSYIEVRRGAHIIVARITWTDPHRFGARTQDLIAADAILGDNSVPTRADQAGLVERRAAPRSTQTAYESSRWAASAMQFACFVAIGGAAALLAFGSVESVLAEPLSSVSAALSTAGEQSPLSASPP